MASKSRPITHSDDILARIDGVNDEEESGMAYPDEKPKDQWDKAEILAKILGAVLLPVITICIAYMLNASIQERRTQRQPRMLIT
jgi:hypothetical protein